MIRSVACCAALAFTFGALAQDPKPAEQPKPAAEQPKPAAEAKPAADDALKPRVKLETTLGDIILELDGEKAPISTDNFMMYVNDKFYDGLIFHRVIPTFMIQGGGFTPEIDKKNATRPPIKNEWKNGLKNVRGTIAMARTSVPDSATSEFFINVVDNGMLDKPAGGAAYAVFGKVIEGMDVVDQIKSTKCIAHPKYGGGGDAVVPETPVIIKSAKALTKYDREKVMANVQEAEKKAKEAGDKSWKDTVDKLEKETGKKMEKTASGLMSVVLKEGSGASPKPTDTVEVHYTGWLLDGTKFDSSVDRGAPATFPLNAVIKGWTEGVGLMKVGEKRKLLIPYELAYGAGGRPPKIPPAAPLLFEIELLAIK
jgi:peptidyl-prolyl cis-trans isomerase A (cyclophilin A)